MDFSNLLIQWYLKNKRDLPWRNTTDSYAIWLSEIILQQTRVAQGLPYYLRFMEAFPTVFDLANASENDVLVLWQGLGYYSRARNMHKTAQHVASELNGVFPETYVELKKLKGVGDYTAAAIASFCNNEEVPVIDGNVYRVLSRYFGIKEDISMTTTRKVFVEIAKELIPPGKSYLFNQAIMEFGALQCVPKKADCMSCIFNNSCFAFANNSVEIFPVKSKKTKTRDRFFNYMVFFDEHKNVLVNKRTEKDIWQNLHEFPLIETEQNEDYEKFLQTIEEKFNFADRIVSIKPFYHHQMIHKLSHQNLHIKFWHVLVSGELKNGLSIKNLSKLPFPIVIFNFIEKELLKIKKK